MCDILLFGGTSEGRIIADYLSEKNIPSIVCTATEYGGDMVNITSKAVRLSTKRLDYAEIAELLQNEQPRLVVDATHPYAADITKNLRTVCAHANTPYTRVLRETLPAKGCFVADSMEELVSHANSMEGLIFSALGVKEASELTAISDYESRVFLRILPQSQALSHCLELGFPAKHIICMQGPFSRSLNRAMFESTGVSVLLTKESGSGGGFEEKLTAAKELGIKTVVLRRPPEEGGLSLADTIAFIGEHIK